MGRARARGRLARALREGRADTELFRTLATLRRDAPVTERLADLEWHGVPREPWLALCEALGLGHLRSRPHRWLD